MRYPNVYLLFKRKFWRRRCHDGMGRHDTCHCILEIVPSSYGTYLYQLDANYTPRNLLLRKFWARESRLAKFHKRNSR